MTRETEDLARYKRIAVVLDVCSSTAILEDLLQTNNEKAWRDLLIRLKQFLSDQASAGQFQVYKFIGDGWILLFDEQTTGGFLVKQLQEVCDCFDSLFSVYVEPLLQGVHRAGLTFGVDSGELVRIEMNDSWEFIGRPLNMAARVQSALTSNELDPTYKSMFTSVAFNQLFRWSPVALAERDAIPLKNVRGGQPTQVVKLPLRPTAMPSVTSNVGAPPKQEAKRYQLRENFDRAQLRTLITDFRGRVRRPIDVRLADRLEAELLSSSDPQVRPNTLKQLARWCKTESPLYADGMAVARKISMLLFGTIVDRETLNT